MNIDQSAQNDFLKVFISILKLSGGENFFLSFPLPKDVLS